MTRGISQPRAFPRTPRRARGIGTLWLAVVMIVLTACASFAVDFGHVQLVKQELQRSADAAALATVAAYYQSGSTAAFMAGPAMLAANQVDNGSGYTPTAVFTYGSWSAATRTFYPNNYGYGTLAVRVELYRTKATSNAIPLSFGGLIGMRSCDVRVSAVATLVGGGSSNLNVPAIANPYFGGSSSGTASPWGDNQTNATPFQATGITVTPGTWISFNSVTGTTSILPGYLGYYGPEGEATRLLHHGQNQNGADWGIGPENGIADAVIPANTFMGVFLTASAPNTSAAPAMVDWSSAASRDQAKVDTVEVKQPFPIGDGRTSGGVVQRFLVPPGATRLYLGIWDGVQQSNNGGSLAASIEVKESAQLVR